MTDEGEEEVNRTAAAMAERASSVMDALRMSGDVQHWLTLMLGSEAGEGAARWFVRLFLDCPGEEERESDGDG